MIDKFCGWFSFLTCLLGSLLSLVIFFLFTSPGLGIPWLTALTLLEGLSQRHTANACNETL